MPLLNATNDIHTQLPILLQSVFPVCRNGIAQSQVSCDAANHHLAHLIVIARVRVDVLDPPQARVCLIVVVECAHSLHDVITQLGDLELFTEEVEVEKWSDVLFGLWVAQGAGVEPADKELEGKVVGVGETVGLGFAFAVLFVVEDVAEEGGVVAQELFVYRPASVFRAHVNVDEGRGEESGIVELARWHDDVKGRDILMERLLGLLGGGGHSGELRRCDVMGDLDEDGWEECNTKVVYGVDLITTGI